MAKKQTAGRDRLGKIAPKFAELNDDVLFGEVWSREDKLSPRDRSMVTIAALFSAGLYPQLKSHLTIGKEHGVTKTEVVEIVTQLAFYCGWPKAWSTFPLIEEVYGEDEGAPAKNLSVFPVGDVVNIPAEVKHWHGAAKDTWFQHLAVEVSGEETGTEWCEHVGDEEYNILP